MYNNNGNVHFNIYFLFCLCAADPLPSKHSGFPNDEGSKGGGWCLSKLLLCVIVLMASVPLGLAVFYSAGPQAGRSKSISKQSVKLLACDLCKLLTSGSVER